MFGLRLELIALEWSDSYGDIYLGMVMRFSSRVGSPSYVGVIINIVLTLLDRVKRVPDSRIDSVLKRIYLQLWRIHRLAILGLFSNDGPLL